VVSIQHPEQLDEGRVAHEGRRFVADLKVVVEELRKVDLDDWDRVKFLLSEIEPVAREIRNEVRRLEDQDMALERKDRLFNRVTHGPGGNGWSGWSG
jgi:hypothetical protein